MLTPSGVDQANVLACGMAELGVTLVVSSDLQRAVATADIVGSHLGVARLTDVRLRERRHDAWSGRRWDDIGLDHPGVLAAWRAGRLVDLPGGAEPWSDFRGRVLASLREHACGDGTVAVVAHAGIFRVVETHCAIPNHVVENTHGRWLVHDEHDLRDAGPYAPP